MGIIRDRIFYHHADTSVLGGHFTDPVEGIVPLQAPLSLSPSGGSGEARSEHFSFHKLISFLTGYSQVSGKYDATKKVWITEAKVTIEGLNIRDRVKVARLVAKMVTEHPEEGGHYEPSVTLKGSVIEGLEVDGTEVKIDLDPEFLKNQPTLPPGTPRRPLIESAKFLGKVKNQYADTVQMHQSALSSRTASKTDDVKDVSQWVANRYAAHHVDAKMDQRGAVLCSMVKSITVGKPVKGKFPGATYGNILEVKDLGRLFFGEIVLDRNTHRIIMLRAELGSSATGNASAGSASVEGRPWP